MAREFCQKLKIFLAIEINLFKKTKKSSKLKIRTAQIVS